MKRTGRAWAAVMTLLVSLSVAAQAQTPKLPNQFCPIIHDRLAVPEHWSDYKGRRIYFCCDDCKRTFDLDPESVRLPPAPLKVQGAGGHEHGPGYAEWAALVGGSTKGDASGESHGHAFPILFGIASLALTGLIIARVRGVRGRTTPALGAVLLLALVSMPWALAWQRAQQRVGTLEAQLSEMAPFQKEHALNLIHYATFIEYGTPPRPKHPPLGPRLSATYYRGNDERSDKLFNGGNYRTATLNLSVRDEKGVRKAGDSLTGAVFVRFEIVRAAFTPDYFFSKPRLSKIYLTADAAPDTGAESAPKDRTGLEETEPAQRWQADYRLGPVTSSTQGIIYVREQFDVGARFHYAIQYDLQIEDGRLGKNSDLFMGALYRTRAVGLDTVPTAEWLSHLPIPEKPAEGTTDPKLLGIDADKRQ